MMIEIISIKMMTMMISMANMIRHSDNDQKLYKFQL